MKRRKHRKLSRRVATREPLKKFTIFCEGKNTEPQYFKALQLSLRGALLEIEILGAIGTPYTIAKTAMERVRKSGLSARGRRKLDSYEQGDQVWAVFDRDEHPRFQEAVEICRQHGIGVGRSNPCFEIWLILHFEAFDKPVGRHKVQKKLEELCPEYSSDKGKVLDCMKLVELMEAAEDKADAQLKSRELEGKPFGAPSTTVFNLTREIKKAAKSSGKG